MTSTIAGLPLPQADPQLDESATVLDLFSLKGKVASISGASTGIGLEVCTAFAQAGSNLAMWYNSTDPREQAEAIASKYGVKVKTYKCQVTDSAQVEKTVLQQVEDFGKVDIFIANAGIPWRTGNIIDEPNNDQYHNLMKVNLDGAYYCAKAIGKQFKHQGYGSLIFTASMSGSIVNTPQRRTVYCASKAAVIHLARSLAVEWAGFARVNCISPGYTRTNIFAKVPGDIQAKWIQQTPMGRLGLTKEVIGGYLYLASDASTYTTGANIAIDGGYTCP